MKNNTVLTMYLGKIKKKRKKWTRWRHPHLGVPEVWCGPQSKLFLPLASHPPSLSKEQGSAADTTCEDKRKGKE